MSNNLTIAELVKQASANNGSQDALIKSAHEQGIEDAERVTKVASYTGDIMGTQAFESFHSCIAQSLGFNPEEEVVKQASIQDMFTYMLADSFEKIAEAYSPQTGGANLVSTQQAGADQLREAGKAHAVMAVQAAQDAVASIDQGDPNTAIQSLNTAHENMTLARQATEAVDDPELNAQVAQAGAVLEQVANTIVAQ